MISRNGQPLLQTEIGDTLKILLVLYLQWFSYKTVWHAEVATEELSQFGSEKHVLRATEHDPLGL